VVELKVDEGALMARMENRVKETLAAGGQVRKDDNPDTFRERLETYTAQTAPLSDFYAKTGRLKQIDGMQDIDAVTTTINGVLAESAPA
ncbi:MAG: nucleoside monophosphate kinase, partial [Pseudomonadota bacterium]